MFRSVYKLSSLKCGNVKLFYSPRVHKSEKRCWLHIRKMASVSSTEIFKGTQDRYNGITVESGSEKCDSELFPKKLEDSLKTWIQSGKRGIWFKVNLQESAWVPILAKNDFKFHHAHQDFVMMYKWLPEKTEPCNVPPYAHTNLGVGAIVINDSNQILVVREKYFEVPNYKLPGGYVERGEDIADASMREVKEETGIDTEFHSLISFRHAHNGMFGNSDIYMIVQLKPTSFTIQRCERELAECLWMDLDEFLNHPNVHSLNRKLINEAVEFKKRGIKTAASKDFYQLATMKREFTVFTLEDV